MPQASASCERDELIIGQMGNLMLIDGQTNGMLSSNNFKSKKQILIDRGYKIPEILKEADQLTPDVILANTKRVSELAFHEVWKV